MKDIFDNEYGIKTNGHHKDDLSKPGAIRLSNEQQQEARKLGFKSTTDYIQWKIKGKTPDYINETSLLGSVEIDSNGLLHTANKNGGVSTELMQAMIAMERKDAEIKRLMDEINRIKEGQSLSGLQTQHQNDIEDLKKELEVKDLKTNLEKYEKEASEYKKKSEKLEEERDELESNLSKTTNWLNVAQMAAPGVLGFLSEKFPSESKKVVSLLSGLVGGEAGIGEVDQGSDNEFDQVQQSRLAWAEGVLKLFTQNDIPMLNRIIELVSKVAQVNPEKLEKIIMFISEMIDPEKYGNQFTVHTNNDNQEGEDHDNI